MDKQITWYNIFTFLLEINPQRIESYDFLFLGIIFTFLAKINERTESIHTFFMILFWLYNQFVDSCEKLECPEGEELWLVSNYNSLTPRGVWSLFEKWSRNIIDGGGADCASSFWRTKEYL